MEAISGSSARRGGRKGSAYCRHAAGSPPTDARDSRRRARIPAKNPSRSRRKTASSTMSRYKRRRRAAFSGFLRTGRTSVRTPLLARARQQRLYGVVRGLEHVVPGQLCGGQTADHQEQVESDPGPASPRATRASPRVSSRALTYASATARSRSFSSLEACPTAPG